MCVVFIQIINATEHTAKVLSLTVLYETEGLRCSITTSNPDLDTEKNSPGGFQNNNNSFCILCFRYNKKVFLLEICSIFTCKNVLHIHSYTCGTKDTGLCPTEVITFTFHFKASVSSSEKNVVFFLTITNCDSCLKLCLSLIVAW